MYSKVSPKGRHNINIIINKDDNKERIFNTQYLN